MVDSDESMLGLHILMIGWLGPLAGNVNPAWYANILLLVSLVNTRAYPRLSKEAALSGFVVAMASVFLEEVIDDSGSDKVSHLGIGFYVWLTCFPLAFVASCLKDEPKKNSEHKTVNTINNVKQK